MIYPNKLRNLERLDHWLRAGCYAALALAIVFLFRCVFDSIRHQPFARTPGELTRSIELTKSVFGSRQTIEAANYRSEVPTVSHSVPLTPEPYVTEHICLPLRTYRQRSEPAVFPVQSLRASSGFDAFWAKSSDRKQQGYRWVVVTGVIEYRQQQLAFESALRGAAYRNPALDSPAYQELLVDRAEVGRGDDDRDLRWQPLPVQAMYDLRNNWPHYGADPVEEKFFPPTCGGTGLIFPLGPRLNGVWGDDVSHPQLAIYEAETKKTRSSPPVAAPSEDSDSFDNDHRGNPAPKRTNDSISISTMPDIRLFRFFDYDVQPAAKYRYRVKLLLRNPNYRVPVKYLESETFTENRTLDTHWSAPTPAIAVPAATTVVVAAANAARGWAQVKLVHFDLKTGDYQTGDFSIERGQVINFYGQEFYPTTDASRPADANPLLPPPARQKPPAPELVDYVTDLTLVDCQEGRRLPARHLPTQREVAPPARILVMDVDGRLAAVEEDVHPRLATPKASARQIVGAGK